jgi:ribosome maturation factor RimP
LASNIESKVEELVKPIIENIGYSLYDVLYEKEGKDHYLRIFIDKDGVIDINDCENVNNAITDILDEADYIKDQYYLEVSSPGLERNLRKEEQFLSQIGNSVCIKLFNKINNEKEIIGILKEYNEKGIVLEIDNNNLEIDRKNIAAAKTVYEW